MTPKKTVDYLIIGQGLAGSLLGWRLIQQHHTVLIVDPCLQQTASRTAAGLINPITGKRLVKAPNTENQLLAASTLYKQLADFFGRPFFYEKDQIRLFQSEDEIKQWNKRKSQADYRPFLAKRFSTSEKHGLKMAPLGGFEQKQCGYLDTVALLDHLRHFFLDQQCFINQHMDLDDLKISPAFIEWQGHLAKKVIFCDGHHLRHNKWFSWLPLQPVQGEVLTLQSQQPVFDEIVQFGNWLLPLSNGTLKLGASWQWQPLDEKPNEKTSAELLARFYQHFPKFNSAQLLDVNVGIRPGTRDKHPFLGTHPTFSQLTVFNGFGSKGSLLIPWYSNCFLRHLTEAETLPQTVDIHRYKNDYFTG